MDGDAEGRAQIKTLKEIREYNGQEEGGERNSNWVCYCSESDVGQGFTGSVFVMN